MRARYLASLLTPVFLLLGLSIGAQAQETTDSAIEEMNSIIDAYTTGAGAGEDICAQWGFSGTIHGLCNAYCEAMDCDSANPQASDQACDRIFDKIIAGLGDMPFPTCNDTDDDGVPNGIDNCPNASNPQQIDIDGDGIGSGCDNCAVEPNPLQEDTDMDGVGTACDNCPNAANPAQEDGDGNGIGDACDSTACPCNGLGYGPNVWPPGSLPAIGDCVLYESYPIAVYPWNAQLDTQYQVTSDYQWGPNPPIPPHPDTTRFGSWIGNLTATTSQCSVNTRPTGVSTWRRQYRNYEPGSEEHYACLDSIHSIAAEAGNPCQPLF